MSVRRLLAAAAVVTAAAVTSGCVGVLASDSPSQLDEIGDARVTTDVCLGANALGGLFGGPTFARGEGDPPAPPALECIDFGGSPVDFEALRTRLSADRDGVAVRDATRPTHEDLVNSIFGGISASQLLVSYKVPAGADAPETIQGAVTVDPEWQQLADAVTENVLWPMLWEYPGDGFFVRADGDVEAPEPAPKVTFPTGLTMRRSDSLSQQMGDAGAGMQWVGYVSDQLPLLTTGMLRLETDFELPEPADGSPYAGPFAHETLVGGRVAFTRTDIESLALIVDALDLDDNEIEELFGNDILELLAELLDTEDVSDRLTRGGLPIDLFAAASPQRPVTCEGDPGFLGLNDDLTLCAFTPTVENDATLATRDLRVDGGQATVQQGQTAQVPFQLRFAGPAATQPLSLSGVTNLPFGTATPQNASWTPTANEQRTELVDVPVPADARPGTYEVNLLVEVGDELRLGVGRLTVTPAPGAPPQVVVQQQQQPIPPITIRIERLRMGRRSGSIAFGFICPRSLGDACDEVRADLFVNGNQLEDARKAKKGRKARKAARSKGKRGKASQSDRKFLLSRVGRTTFEAEPGERVRVRMTLSSKAKRYVNRGRWLSGRLVIRAGDVKQVRHIVIIRH